MGFTVTLVANSQNFVATRIVGGQVKLQFDLPPGQVP